MKTKIKAISKTTIFFILLFLWSYIPIIFFNFDINKLDFLGRIIYSLVCDITFLILIIVAYHKTLIKDFKNFFSDFLNNIETSFKYWFAGFCIMIVSNLIITVIMQGGMATNEEQVRTLIGAAPLYMLFDVAIYAPFTEELIFRKGFRDIFKNKWIYILASGITFGSLHVLSSLTSISALLYLIPYCSLGIAFAYSYYKTNNIFSTISMHMLHNTLAITIYFIGGI